MSQSGQRRGAQLFSAGFEALVQCVKKNTDTSLLFSLVVKAPAQIRQGTEGANTGRRLINKTAHFKIHMFSEQPPIDQRTIQHQRNQESYEALKEPAVGVTSSPFLPSIRQI